MRNPIMLYTSLLPQPRQWFRLRQALADRFRTSNYQNMAYDSARKDSLPYPKLVLDAVPAFRRGDISPLAR